ncbi:hypothetical protein BN7_3264 [Wickerhamomyces ciferrii]|uniref:Uncharacterized protein n=1 Tax=Wickerhamomyces ciferrii (strain ATCC 14091 / BCRC 22168 / CBS 111 / JCM 3599 / NBRC 0793 / NRRL Y-1031 F-60-10) TaxID=1206466 RepID=K0KEZ7_WICCF|nr:uncharacterized protein BN7_3264 [Wickerhamomyces ciferrii]CCH43710.1 hypothetical protein BN7_3264 [Wickerhamomyces ciferrii]
MSSSDFRTPEIEKILNKALADSITTEAMKFSLRDYGLLPGNSEMITKLIRHDICFNFINLCMSNQLAFFSPLQKQYLSEELQSILPYQINELWSEHVTTALVIQKSYKEPRGVYHDLDNTGFSEIQISEIQSFNQKFMDKYFHNYISSLEDIHRSRNPLNAFLDGNYNSMKTRYEILYEDMVSYIDELISTAQSSKNANEEEVKQEILEILIKNINVYEPVDSMKTWFRDYIKDGFIPLLKNCGKDLYFRENTKSFMRCESVSDRRHLNGSSIIDVSKIINSDCFENIVEIGDQDDGKLLIQFDDSPQLEIEFETEFTNCKPLQNLVTCLISRNTRVGILTNMHFSVLITLFPKGYDAMSNEIPARRRSLPEIRYRQVNHTDTGLTMNWLMFYAIGLVMDENDDHTGDDDDSQIFKARFRPHEFDEPVSGIDYQLSSMKL